MSVVRPLVVFGPSGVGKGTLLARLLAEHPDQFGFSVSHTTRQPRPGESDGTQYHFVSPDAFNALLADHAFIEHAQFSNNLYGTSKRAVAAVHASGRRCLLDIDAQGVRQVKQTDLNPVYLFIAPPSMSALRSRLRGRATDSEAAIQRRLATALAEIEYARQPGTCDYVVVNDNLDRAYIALERVALGQHIDSDVIPSLDD